MQLAGLDVQSPRQFPESREMRLGTELAALDPDDGGNTHAGGPSEVRCAWGLLADRTAGMGLVRELLLLEVLRS
jgi:hypothetical protein